MYEEGKENSFQLTDRIESVIGMVNGLRRAINLESGVAKTQTGT